MAASSGYRAPSVGRALKILELVAESQQGLGISELSRRLKISKGTVFGLCNQLEASGALTRDAASKRYGLGPLVATLARRGFAQAALKDAAAPEMTRLCGLLDESVFLGVMGRNEIMVLEARQPPESISISAGPGTRLPLLAGAVGKVFLAGLPPAQVEEILARGLPAHTPHSVTDPGQYAKQLDLVRKEGYAVEQDEFLRGLWGVAASLGVSGGLPAALYVVGFSGSLQPGRLEQVAAEVLASARRIQKNLA